MAAKDKQMDKKQNTPVETEQSASGEKLVSESRRRFSKAGLASSGIILTVSSRSALGGWGTCTRSEMLSGNLSRAGTPNPCGCSPGYWFNNNGTAMWDSLVSEGVISAQYGRSQSFNTTFGVTFFAPDVQLGQVTPKDKNKFPLASPCKNGEGVGTAAFHAVAALLNASVYGTMYPSIYHTPSSVINAFQSAANTFKSSTGCKDNSQLTAFKSAVDKYDSSQTWCFGSQHTG